MQVRAVNWMRCSPVFKFVLSQKIHTVKILNVLQRFTKCRNATSVCVCTQARAGGKPQFWSLALEKAIKALERGKPQSIIRSFAAYLRCFWRALPWHLSPSLSPAASGAPSPARPAEPGSRSSEQKQRPPLCQSLHLLPQQGSCESSVYISHCMVLETSAICYCLSSHASQKYRWLNRKQFLYQTF